MHGPTTEKLGDRLKRAMELAGLTIDQLHARSGYSRWYISCLRTGARRNPSIAVVRDLAETCGVSPGWLAYGEGDIT